MEAKYYQKFEFPEIMFLFFDIVEEIDDTFQVYNNIKLYSEQIINYIEEELYIFNSKYALKDILYVCHM